MKSLTEVLEELEQNGYDETFRAQESGLCATKAGHVYPSGQLHVDESIRIENASDPDNQVLVLALHTTADPKLRGTYVVTYGTNMPPVDSAMLQQLDV